MNDLTHYFVTDVETDGPDPDKHSMMSFATVVVREDGVLRGSFEANLEPLADRTADPDTMAWWKTQPDAWAASRAGARAADAVMSEFADWVEGFAFPRMFAARPLAFDGMWIDAYLRRLTGTRLFDGPFRGRQIFHGSGLDLTSYMKGLFGHTGGPSTFVELPAEWLGDHEHTHRAIDDARGYAHFLSRMLELAASAPRNAADFTDQKL